MFGFGSNAYGQLGVSDREEERFVACPRQVILPDLGGARVISAACGMSHSLLLTGSCLVSIFLLYRGILGGHT